MSGANLAASGSCTFSVNVMQVASGPQINTTGKVTSNEGGTGNGAVASLGVLGCPNGDTAYLFTGTTKTPSTIVGVFCVTKTGQATYQQGTASSSGGVNINCSSNNFIALGSNMNHFGCREGRRRRRIASLTDAGSRSWGKAPPGWGESGGRIRSLPLRTSELKHRAA